MEPQKQKSILTFLTRIVKGIPIGVAFIIPGFSGGSVAAILGIYDELLEAITGILKHFGKSLAFLIPILLGMLIGAGALLFPLRWGLSRYPIVVASLFIGLAIGGLPSITSHIKGKWSVCNVFAFLLPLVITAAIGFIPAGKEVDLMNVDFIGYVLLFLVGLIGAAALVVPGISGSMLLLILGYYNPILGMLTDHLLKGDMVFHSLTVIVCVGLGIAVGFFLISLIMKTLLRKYPKGTYIAIVGFIIGSVPAVYLASCKDVGMTLATLGEWMSPLLWVFAAIFLAVGFAASFCFVKYMAKTESADKSDTEAQLEESESKE